MTAIMISILISLLYKADNLHTKTKDISALYHQDILIFYPIEGHIAKSAMCPLTLCLYKILSF